MIGNDLRNPISVGWRERFGVWLLLAPALAVIVFLFLGGLLLGLLQSFNYLPLVGKTDLNLDAYRNIFSSRSFILSFLLTLHIAFTSTLISTVLAVIFALFLRETFVGKRIMTFIFQLNLPIPHIVGAVALVFLFSQSGLLSRLANSFGLIQDTSQFPILVFDPYGIGVILEYVWKEVPFIGIIVLAILNSIGDDYENLARSLGANRWQRFRFVLLPLMMPGILSASVIVFAFAFGAFEIPFFLGVTYPRALPVLAYYSYSDVDLNARSEAMAMSMIVALMISILVFVYMQLSRRFVRSE